MAKFDLSKVEESLKIQEKRDGVEVIPAENVTVLPGLDTSGGPVMQPPKGFGS